MQHGHCLTWPSSLPELTEDSWLHPYDFDDGTAARSPLGADDLGLGDAEANTGKGDSGGPSLITNAAGQGEIVAITSFGQVPTGNFDLTNYVNGAGRRISDSSFGEGSGAVRVSPYLTGFIRPNTPANGHIVLDMNKQVLGLDGRDRAVDILVRPNQGGGIQIIVNDPENALYSGVYYQGPATALTIRGSSDHETVRFVGNLGLNTIEVFGRDGDDTVLVDMTAGDPIGANFSFDGGAGTNRIRATGNVNYTLADTAMTAQGMGTVTLANVTRALLTGGRSDNTFTVSGWTGTATLEGEDGNDTVISRNDADFELKAGQLDRLTGGTFLLGQFETAILTGDAGANRFTISDTTLDIDLDGAGSNGDEVVVIGAGNFTLTNTVVTRSVGRDITLRRIEEATLIGDAQDNTFTVTDWTRTATLANGGGGNDEVVSVNNVDFTLTDALLTRSSGAEFELVGINSAQLTGGDRNNTFTVSGWTGKAELDGSGNTRDRVISTNDTDFDLNFGVITRSDGAQFNIRNIEETEITGGASANQFTLDWNGLVRIYGEGDDDRLIVNGGVVTLSLTNTEDWLFTQGAVTLDNNVALDTFVMNGGTLTGRRSLTIRKDGSWNGGTWEGTGANALVAVLANAAFEIAGPDPKRMVNYELINSGTFQWVGPTEVTAVNSLISNESTVTLDGRIRLTADGKTRFVNTGTFDKISENLVTFTNVRFENSGDVRLHKGGFFMVDGSYTQSQGSTIIEDFNSFLDKAVSAIEIRGGVIGGNGLVFGDVLVTGGKMAPGGSPGRLAVTGKYTQRARGEFEVELRNQTETGYDQLSVDGGVSLAGKLTIIPLPGFNGNEFMLIKNTLPAAANPVDGTFQGLPEGAQVMVAAQAYRITYRGGDGNDVVLRKVNQVPEVRVAGVRQLEGTGANTEFRFTVSLSQVYGEPVTVSYRTVDGTATAGSDYEAIDSGTVVFAPGDLVKEIVVTVIGDAKVEPDETFFVQLTGATNCAIVDEFALGTIVNDDHTPQPQNDDAATTENAPVTIAVLGNDTDPDGSALFVTSVGPAGYGSVTVNVDQTVTYTPHSGFAGIDQFTYVVSDGANVESATVYVSVAPRDDGIYLIGGRPGDVLVTFTWTEREAGYNNELFFYRVDDAQGRIGSLLPGDTGYAAAALQRTLSEATVVFTSGEGAGATRTFQLPAGTLIAFGFAQNSTTASWNSANPANTLALSPHGFFSLPAANPDAFDHFRRALDQFFIEDLDGGGDQDFNDVVFRVTTTRP